MIPRAAEQFARVVVEMAPYAHEIVFVGGWVHALYLAEANEARTIRTDDVDITIPPVLLTGDRPTLLELAERAGFERDPLSDLEGATVMMAYTNAMGDTVPIDFLTEGQPREPVPIIGQRGLTAQGYPGQRMLLESTREMRVGTEIHPMLDPARTIRVPTLGAYVMQKGIASSSRTNPLKAAKDLVYLYEIVRHPNLGRTTFAETPMLRARYPEEHARWKSVLDAVVRTPATLRDICAELSESGRTYSAESDVRRGVIAYFTRLIAEG